MRTLRLEASRLRVTLRRLSFALLVAASVAAISWRALSTLQINGLTPLKTAIFFLFVALLVPIVLSFWTAIIGFIVQWRGGDALELTRTLENSHSPPAPGCCGAAVVMPIYNEDPVRVFAGLKATYESLEQTGWLGCFDFFVLSDTTDPDIWVREELAFAQLRREVRDPARLVYRNRRQNVERKSGNIADFCATWGGRYQYMIVFDADSIMTGLSLVNLVRLMENHPGVGIIQAPPLPVNRRTLFGRVHQFAMRAYSLIFISGLNFWQSGEGNYWGHNAIIRIEPFVKHCRLPRLPGREPLGGSILSHDFVEAALMRRAGWKVYLASDLGGSYEEMPSSLIGYAARDRRWCQGNLQHARLLFTPRFHLVNRIHLGMGVMSYAASPLWLLLLLLTTLQGIGENLGHHPYFSPGKPLFPQWQISVQDQALGLFILMMGILLLPKFLSLITLFHKRDRRAEFGGAPKLLASVLCETIFSTLLAPNLALLQARFVIGILMGKNVKWESQDRGESQTTFSEALRRHWPSEALGLLWTLLLWQTVPKLFWWFSPVIAGFILAVPLSAWSSRTGLGELTRRLGLFLTPEELNPPPVLQRVHEELEQTGALPWALPSDGLGQVLDNPEVCRVHLSLLAPSAPSDPLRRNHLEGLSLKVCLEGLSALTPQEKRELLLDAESIRALRKDEDSQ